MNVYISSTYEDLKSYREYICQALRKIENVKVVAMEDYAATDQRPVEKCLQDVSACEVYIGIFAWRYGYIPEGFNKSITELEYREAVKKNKHKLIFIIDEKVKWPENLKDDPPKQIINLKNELKDTSIVSIFKTKKELTLAVTSSIANYISKQFKQVNLTSLTSFQKRIYKRFPQYFNMLNIPERLESPYIDSDIIKNKSYYVGREKVINILVNKISGIGAKTYEIVGLGGIGKTELVKQVIHKLQNDGFISNGVLWIDLSIHFNDISHILSYIGEMYNIYGLLKIGSIDSQLEFLKFALYNFNSLVILDNADNQEVLKIAYKALSDKNIIITSRRKSYLSNNKTFYLNDLKPETEGVELFKKVILSVNPTLIEDNDLDILTNISTRLSGHPMSIEIVALKSAYENWHPRITLEKIRESGIELIEIPKETVTYLDERHKSLEMTFSLAMNNFSDSTLFNYRINSLLVLCSSFAGEFFYKDEIFIILNKYWIAYNAEKTQDSEIRQENFIKKNSVRKFLEKVTLNDDKKISASYINRIYFQNETFKGYKEINYFITHPEDIDKMLNILVTIGILKKDNMVYESNKYSIHPLVRDYALKKIEIYFTKKLWAIIAEWYKEKATKLYLTEGEQLRNILFFLHVCRETKLMEQFWEILFPIIDYIRKNGLWAHEFEYLKLGIDWCEKEYQDDFALGVFNMQLGYFFVHALKEKKLSKEYFERSFRYFKNLQDNYNICWISYWLNNSFFNNYSSKLLEKKFDNIRICLQNDYEDICVAEFEDLLEIIDPIKNKKVFLEILVSTISLHIKNSSYIDLIRCIAKFTEHNRLIGNYDLAEKSLNVAENLLKDSYDITLEYFILKEKFYFKTILCNSFDEANTILNKINKLIDKINFQNNLLNDVVYTADLKHRRDRSYSDIGKKSTQLFKSEYEYLHGILFIEQNDFIRATKYFEKAIHRLDLIEYNDSYNFLPLLYPLLFLSILLSDAKDTYFFDNKYEHLMNVLKNTQKLIEKYFIQGIISFYKIIITREEINKNFERANYSLSFLKVNAPSYYKFLNLFCLHTTIICENVHYNKNVNLEENKDEVNYFNYNLPRLVRSKKDNRVMKLVQSGLCPIIIENEVFYIFCKSYYIDVHPVTVGDYIKFLKETGHNTPDNWKQQLPSKDQYNLTMWGISNLDAESYMNWAQKKIPNIYELQRITALEKKSKYNLFKQIDYNYQIEQYLQVIKNSFLTKNKKDQTNSSQALKTDLKRFKTPKWNEGLPKEITAVSFLRIQNLKEEICQNFLNLLSMCLSYSIYEKEDIISNIKQITEEDFEAMMIFLSEEEKYISEFDLTLNNELEQLTIFRWKQWINYVFRKCGFKEPYHLSKDSQDIYNSMSAYDYAPPFDRFFPNNYSFEKSLSNELIDSERKSAKKFIQNLSSSTILSLEKKIHVISTLDDGINTDLNGLSVKLEFERTNNLENIKLSENFVHLQKKWKEWKRISNYFITIHAESKTLFWNKKKLLKRYSLEDIPYFSISKWNKSLSYEEKEYKIISQDKLDLHDDLFLDLLSESISLSIEEKRKVIDKVDDLSQNQINELLCILAEERKQFKELSPVYWPEIHNMVGSAKQQWKGLVQEKLFQKNNPYRVLHHWKRFVTPDYNIRDFFSKLPISSYKENYLLSLIACSIFIGKKQKKKLITKLPELNKNELLNLINLFKEHYIFLQNTDSSNWSVLWQWFGKIYEEWNWVLKEIAGKSKINNPLKNRCFWELTYTSISKLNAFFNTNILENFDYLILFNILSYSFSLCIDDKKELLQNLSYYSSEQIYAITQKFYYEFYTLTNLNKNFYFWLSGQILKAENDWFMLSNELFEIKKKDYINTGFKIAEVIDVEKKLNFSLFHLDRKNDYNKFGFKFSFIEDLSDNILKNPETVKRSCFSPLPHFFDIKCFIEEHPNSAFSELDFLELLSSSISFTKDEKWKIIKSIPDLSQKQIDTIIAILLREKWMFYILDKSHWLLLRFLKETHWELWDQLVIDHLPDFFRYEIDKTVEFKNKKSNILRRNDININHHDLSVLKLKDKLPKNHPYQNEPNFFELFDHILDLRNAIPDHFNTYFPEKEFLQFLGSSPSLSLEEKISVISSIPNLSQCQIDELINIFINEKLTFANLKSEHWDELSKLFFNYWEVWLNALYTHAIFEDFLTIDTSSYDYSFLSKKNIWHWSSNVYYENKKKYTVAAGGPTIKYLPSTNNIENYSKVILDNSVAYDGFVVAFRGCIPIVSFEDMEGLEEINNKEI